MTPRLAFAGINLSKSGGEHGAAPRHCSYEGARPAIYQMCDPGPVLSITGVAALLPPAPERRFDGTLRQVVRGRQRWPRGKVVLMTTIGHGPRKSCADIDVLCTTEKPDHEEALEPTTKLGE